jgi:hypothetical protein
MGFGPNRATRALKATGYKVIHITLPIYQLTHGLLNYIDTKPKCRRLKILTCKVTLRQVFICLRPSPILTPYPPFPYTVYVHTVNLFTQGRGGGGRDEPERRLEGQQLTNLGRKCQHD